MQKCGKILGEGRKDTLSLSPRGFNIAGASGPVAPAVATFLSSLVGRVTIWSTPLFSGLL